MPGTVSHVLSATTPDDPTFEIRPSHWNSSHLFTLNASGSEISNAFGNAGGVTFGYDGTNVTASAPGAAPQPVNFSAGTTSDNLGSVVFSNSNRVSFGLNGSTITGSIASSLTNVNVSAGTTSNNLSAITFSNSNGVSFGLNGSTLTGSVATSLTNINVSAGTTSNNLSAVTFSNSNGVSFGLNGSTLTGSVATSLTNINVSAGTTSNNLSAVTFSNSNGVSFGLNGSTLTGSVATSLTNINVSAGTTSNNLSAITFSNSNGVSFGLNGSTLTGSVAAQSVQTQPLSVYATSNTTQSSSGTMAANSLLFAGAGIASIGVTNGSVVISVPAGGGAGDGGVFAGVSTMGNTDGSTGTVSTGNFVLVATGAATFSQSTGAAGSAATVTLSVPATSSIVGTNGISISTNGSTISVSPQFISSYENGPFVSDITMTLNGASVSHGVAINMPWALSASFIRIPVAMSTNSTTLSTLASSMNGSAQVLSTWNAVVYSLGTGANSQSLRSVASGSVGFTFLNSISVAANGTQYSVTQGYSANAQGGGTTRTTQYSISNTNYSFTTNQIATEFSGSRFIDINFANSLTPGPYWLIFGYSSSTQSNSARCSAATNCGVYYASHYGNSQVNRNFGIMGSTNLTSGGLLGAGSFSTAGGGTTNSIPISAISSSTSNVRPYIQMLRSA